MNVSDSWPMRDEQSETQIGLKGSEAARAEGHPYQNRAILTAKTVNLRRRLEALTINCGINVDAFKAR